MRVLFDQGTLRSPAKIVDRARRFDRIRTRLVNAGNGDLLNTAEREGFEVLVTTDGNLQHQQDLRAWSIAIVVLTTTSWPRIERDIPAVVRAVNGAAPGSYVEVSFGPRANPRVGRTQASRRSGSPRHAQVLGVHVL